MKTFWTLLALGFVVLISTQVFVFPSTSAPHQADAVFLFAGGRGERLDRALSLMEEGIASTLVISHGEDWPEGRRLCEEETRFEVVCFRPEPDTTRGEAQYVGRLAAERDWDRVVVVTSTYHVARSRILTERCASAEVEMVGANPRLDPPHALRVVVREWVGMIDILALDRAC